MENNKLLEKLSAIQNELKAPKGQYNNFGKYKYRSCEDILEALKPICKKHKTVLKLSDELKQIGERYYVEATAILFDLESENKIETTASAREEETKKGMDGSQITGTASSYARKYALNGLFNIDDTKDADTDEYQKQTNKPIKQPTQKTDINYRDILIKYIKSQDMDFSEVAKEYKLNSTTEDTRFKKVYETLKANEEEK